MLNNLLNYVQKLKTYFIKENKKEKSLRDIAISLNKYGMR